jgi:hypothetical protein
MSFDAAADEFTLSSMDGPSFRVRRKSVDRSRCAGCLVLDSLHDTAIIVENGEPPK